MESQDLASTMFLITMLGFYMVLMKQDEQIRRLRRLERMLLTVPGAGDPEDQLHPTVIAKIGAGQINAAIKLHHTIAAISLGEAYAAVNSYIAAQDQPDGTLCADSRETNSSAGTGRLKK